MLSESIFIGKNGDFGRSTQLIFADLRKIVVVFVRVKHDFGNRFLARPVFARQSERYGTLGQIQRFRYFSYGQFANFSALLLASL